MRRIRELGYDIKSVYFLRGKHIEALVGKWKTEGGAGAIQNRLAILRALSKWIGKNGIVLPARDYALNNPAWLKLIRVAAAGHQVTAGLGTLVLKAPVIKSCQRKATRSELRLPTP